MKSYSVGDVVWLNARCKKSFPMLPPDVPYRIVHIESQDITVQLAFLDSGEVLRHPDRCPNGMVYVGYLNLDTFLTAVKEAADAQEER